MNEQLLIVASVAFDHSGQTVEHAMVLNTYDETRDVLIFKNTYDVDGQLKKFEIERTHQSVPKELYFVHIQVRDMASLPSQR